jgi:hypothetical protein
VAVPSQHGVRRRNGRHLLQCLPAQSLAQLRQTPTLPVRQSEPALAEPLQKRRVLRALVLDYTSLVLSEPRRDPRRQNCNGSGSGFSAVTVFAVRPFRRLLRVEITPGKAVLLRRIFQHHSRFVRSCFGTGQELVETRWTSRTREPFPHSSLMPHAKRKTRSPVAPNSAFLL